MNEQIDLGTYPFLPNVQPSLNRGPIGQRYRHSGCIMNTSGYIVVSRPIFRLRKLHTDSLSEQLFETLNS